MQLQFFGAAGEVTGSMTLVETGKARILIDCGMFQGDRSYEARNRQLPPQIDQLDAVVLTHAHLDHCGRLPLLVRRGYEGPIFTTSAGFDIAKIILADAAHIQEEDARRDSRRLLRRGKAPVAPLYDRSDVLDVLPFIRRQPYRHNFDVAPGIRATFHDAGHILGSASVRLYVEDGGRERILVFSGDLGMWPQPILGDPEALHRAEVLILESTYGDRDHRPIDETLAELAQIITTAKAQRGRILIPAFAVGRTQTLLYHLRTFSATGLLDGVPVFLDSPMAIAATEAYRRHPEVYDADARALLEAGKDPLDFPELKFLPSTEDSRILNTLDGPAIIIAGSGMLNGGRILHHLKHHIWRENTHLVIVGFQARGTLGRQLVDGARTIQLHGETVIVRGQVHTLGGLSAHAGRSELLQWASSFSKASPLVILNHGEDDARAALAAELSARFGYRVERPGARATIKL